MIRSTIGVIVGLVAGACVVGLVEWIGRLFYPLPPDLDIKDMEALGRYVAGAPLGALLFVLLAWVAGAVTGAWLAALIARRSPAVHGMIVGGILLAMTIVNLVMIPHPLWIMIAAVLSIPLAAWNGASMAPRTRTAPING